MACACDIATGCAANALSNVLSCLWNKVLEKVKPVIFLRQAVTQMKKDAKNLDNKIHEIKVELDQAQQSPKRAVKTWLEEAEELKERSESIGTKYETHQQHENYIGCCPKCLCRYRISKAIIDWNRNVSELQSQRAKPDFPGSGNYGDPAPRSQIKIDIPKFWGNGIKDAELELERWLTEDTSVRSIGVCGMGGVGKTSLLQTINNSHKVRQSFQLIIWLTVSKDYDILNLQNDIADRLELKSCWNREFNLEKRIHVLCSYLKNKRYLLILDDMWECLNLQRLGVSLNDTAYKIVLSTRSIDVCNQMRVDKTTNVEPLSEEEGWQLFSRGAFRDGIVPKHMVVDAKKIAGECKGLPLAINVIAAAMLNHSDQRYWEDAFHQLQDIDEQDFDETFYDLHDQIEKKLFHCLEWSYNALPTDNLKTCFVYFAAYPEDREIEVAEVLDILVAEGLVRVSEESYLPDTAHRFIKNLTDRCLIEVVKNDEVGRIRSVKIHDVLRDLAIRIAKEQHSCFKAGQGLRNFPSEENSEGCARMSLMKNDLQSLPKTLKCSSLSVMLLRDNPLCSRVPEGFLLELSSLKVLDLSKTNIINLPSSIGNLKHLASLQLEETFIRELPETIVNLEELQFLNVSRCKRLRNLPERIHQLKRLRAFDLSKCSDLSHFPCGMQELVALKTLRMAWSDIQLKAAAKEGEFGRLNYLRSLSSLRVLHVQIELPDKDYEGVMGNWLKMRDLYLRCANQDYLPQDVRVMKDLESFRLYGCYVKGLPSWVSEFGKLAYLELQECKKLEELPAKLPCLRVLRIARCEELKVLELELGMGFPKLEQLTLERLVSLKRVAAAAAASGSGGSGEGASLLPSMLKSLTVVSCPELKRLTVVGCPELKRLHGGWDRLKSIEVIEGKREWWDAIQWEDAEMKASLESKYRSLESVKSVRKEYVIEENQES